MGVEYIVNERGERTKVILSIEEYERLVELVEDSEDLRVHYEEMAKLRSGETERIPRSKEVRG